MNFDNNILLTEDAHPRLVVVYLDNITACRCGETRLNLKLKGEIQCREWKRERWCFM